MLFLWIFTLIQLVGFWWHRIAFNHQPHSCLKAGGKDLTELGFCSGRDRRGQIG
jgi:hypothetical protein